jgi:CRISPR-associated exonuclease Cas4
MTVYYLALALVILGLILLWQSGRTRRAAGLPGGRIIYTDTRAWGKNEKPLYVNSLGLTGKPDYLVRQGEHIIPVEVKSGRAPQSPYDSHIYQIAAYCLLVERVYGERPPYGIVHYTDRDFAIDYTPELEKSLLALLDEMRRDSRRQNVERSHQTSARCRGCGYRTICDDAL